MLSNLTPEQITALAASISLFLFKKLDASEANAINNLLALITSNLSVQLAQQALNQEKEQENTVEENNANEQEIEENDITPLFTI